MQSRFHTEDQLQHEAIGRWPETARGKKPHVILELHTAGEYARACSEPFMKWQGEKNSMRAAKGTEARCKDWDSFI